MQYKPVKSRKQGTSMTLTIPSQFKVCENTLFKPKLLENGAILYSPVVQPDDVEHDREVIEEAFDDDQLLTPTDMKKQFGKYGWGKHAD